MTIAIPSVIITSPPISIGNRVLPESASTAYAVTLFLLLHLSVMEHHLSALVDWESKASHEDELWGAN